MVRDLFAEVKHNAAIKTVAKCQDLEFDPKSAVPGFGDDEQSQRGIAILNGLLHSEAAARAVVGRARAYADDSPFNYSAILKITERLAIKDFCGAEILGIIKSCGDVVAAIDGDDADLAEVALSMADLRTTETEGYTVLSALDYKGIPVFNLLGKMTGKSPDYIKRAA